MAFISWALKRQIFFIIVLLIILSFLGYLITYPYYHRAPTCSDGVQNGTETGVDCGGMCARACIMQVDPISILWSRSFRVVPGRYNAVAYLENHNKDASVEKINYRFRFADENNVYVGKREGSTFVPPGKRFAVFEPAIDVGNSIPVYTTFEFTETPAWLQVSPEKINQLRVFVSDMNLTDPDTAPRLSANIKNNSLFIIPHVNVIAILYDENHNAISASRTYLDQLDREESTQINFTWPEPFSGQVIEKEIIPLYDVFSVKLQ